MNPAQASHIPTGTGREGSHQPSTKALVLEQSASGWEGCTRLRNARSPAGAEKGAGRKGPAARQLLLLACVPACLGGVPESRQGLGREPSSQEKGGQERSPPPGPADATPGAGSCGLRLGWEARGGALAEEVRCPAHAGFCHCGPLLIHSRIHAVACLSTHSAAHPPPATPVWIAMQLLVTLRPPAVRLAQLSSCG